MMQVDLLASVLAAYFARPDSNFATCVRRIVRAELHLLHPSTGEGGEENENDITIPIDTRGRSDSTNAADLHYTSPPPTATSTASTPPPRRNLESSFVAAATTPNKAAESPSPTSGTLSDADYDDSFFCSVDLESLVAAATAGRGDHLPSPILPNADGFDVDVDVAAPARDPAASPMTPPRAVANNSPPGIGPAAACVAEAEGPLPGLGLSPSTPISGLMTSSTLRSVQTSSAFSPANGALSFRPSLVTTDAATPTTTTTFAAAQDRLPPPPPVIDISSSPAASPARAEKSEDDNENENEYEENEEEEDEGVVEEDFGFSENDELDDDDDDEDDGADHLAKEAQDGKGSLMDELFPEDAQQKRRREEKERRQQWLRNFHPPGVPIPVLPPEIIRYIGSFLERRMESYARFASVCKYWRSVATEGEEWERRYAQSFGGPFPRLLLDKYENSSYLNDSLMETQEGGTDDGVATPKPTILPRNKWYQAFLWTFRQHRAIVGREKRTKAKANQRKRSGRQERRERDELDRVLLDWAAKHGHTVIVHKVIRAVAQKAQPANTGVERYLLRHNPHLNSPLHMAVENGHEEVVHMLLEEGEFSVRKYQLRCRPMLMACQFGRLSIAKLLVQYGALADKKGMCHYSTAPMHEAAAKGYLELVELLLDNGCDPNMRAGTTTALADAALHNQIEVVRCLLRRGARPELCNTPVLHLAARNSSAEVVQLLLAHGADATERVQIDRPYGRAITAYEAASSEEVRRVFREYSARNRRHRNRTKKSRTRATVKQEVVDEYDNDDDEQEDEEEQEEEQEEEDDEAKNEMKNSEDEDDRLDDEADESACLDRRKRLRSRRRAKAKSEDDAMMALEEEIEAATNEEPVDHKNEDENHLEDEEDEGDDGVEEHKGKKRPAAVLLELDGSLALDDEEEEGRSTNGINEEEEQAQPPPGLKKKRKKVVCDDDDAEAGANAETATTPG